MLVFTAFDDLFNEIEKDKIKKEGIATRYPIRTLFLNNFINFQNVITKLNVKQIDLSSYLKSPDKWFTSDYLLNLIQNTNESTVVFPLSEVIRFYPNDKLQTILTTLFEIQNNEKTLTKRIYLPLIGLKEKFSDQFWTKFHRQKEGIPVWQYINEQTTERTKIYKLNTNINTKLSLISNNKEWLDFWKTGKENPVINTASSLNRRWNFFQSDDCFESRSLDNIKIFLEEIYNLTIKVEYHDKENEFWNNLLKLYESMSGGNIISFEYFCNQYFNISNISDYEDDKLFLLYMDSNKFDKWLIKCYIGTRKKGDNYLSKIITNCSEYSNVEVIQLLIMSITYLDQCHDDTIQQREILIKSILPKYLNEIIQNIPDFLVRVKTFDLAEQVKLLTGFTILEKEYLVSIYPKIDDQLKHQYKSKLFGIYQYLDWKFFNKIYEIKCPDWIYNYFAYYNETKFLNKTNDNYEALFNEINKNSDTFFKWYYEIEELPQFDSGKVVQIDALGLEWLPYVVKLIGINGKQNNKEISSIKVCRSKLPTITKNNKIENSIYYQELDQLLHDSKGYKYPMTFLNELKIIEKIINEILALSDSKIYLTADHGATCQCMKQFGRIKKYNFNESEHEGRYLTDAHQLSENESFIKFENKLIGLRHDSLYNLPKREVHGGATPEEILIPLITIETKKNSINYNFTLKNTKIEFSNKKINIKIQPKPDIIPKILIKESFFNGQYNGSDYSFDVSSLSSGIFSAKCIIKNQIFEFNFEIIGGLQEEDLF